MTAVEPLSYQFYDRYLPQIEVFGGPDFFSQDLTDKLIVLSNESPERKLQFDFEYPAEHEASIPDVITAAAQWAQSYKVPANTAVLKRYDKAGSYQSEAHQPHRDPDIYGSHRIALVSLSGEAILRVRTSDGIETPISCLPRTVLFLAPHLIHSVTEPLNPDGIRHFLFLGYNRDRGTSTQ